MLRSRGISQIYHTYSEDMHPVYPPLYRGYIYPSAMPRSNHGIAEDYMGAYPPRIRISYFMSGACGRIKALCVHGWLLQSPCDHAQLYIIMYSCKCYSFAF